MGASDQVAAWPRGRPRCTSAPPSRLPGTQASSMTQLSSAAQPEVSPRCTFRKVGNQTISAKCCSAHKPKASASSQGQCAARRRDRPSARSPAPPSPPGWSASMTANRPAAGSGSARRAAWAVPAAPSPRSWPPSRRRPRRPAPPASGWAVVPTGARRVLATVGPLPWRPARGTLRPSHAQPSSPRSIASAGRFTAGCCFQPFLRCSAITLV